MSGDGAVIRTSGRANSGRITIRNVAADAGVSVAAVSKVMRNAYGVSDALRQNVLESIDRLGYRPSVAARGMRGQTYTIGLLLVELDNPFLPNVVGGITSVLDQVGYRPLIGIGRSAMALEASLIEAMIDNRMDGLILIAPRIAGKTLARFAQQIPMVVIAHHEPSAVAFDTVNSDDRAGAALSVRKLVESGYEDIAMLSLQDAAIGEENVSVQREIGYMQAMEEAGLKDRARIIWLARHNADHEESVAAFLSAPDRPRAAFVWSDLAAINILNAARVAGVRVPEDLAIIGYDDSPIAALPLIGLSSVNQDGKRLGNIAAETLLSRIAGRTTAQTHYVEPRLVERTSI